MTILTKLYQMIVGVFDFCNRYFKTLVLFLIVGLLFLPTPEKPANLAKLYLRDIILQSDTFREQVEQITNNPDIQGVLLIIDSPGGAVGSSIEIANLVQELAQKMPVIAHVEGAMASGSYYAGMYATEVIANRGAIIGSIGVVLNGFNVAETLQKLGIKPQGLQAGEYKNIGTPLRAWNPKEKDFLQNFIQAQYQMFVDDVIQARKLTQTNPEVFANGKIFTAKEALKLGLIDKIGSQNLAIQELLARTQVKDPQWLEKSQLDRLWDKASLSLNTFFLNLLKGQIQ
ncbi:hypothetical protein BBW65_06500 [Helicobacter enhydrae]|uniref:Peptidase S49 domain-containing protein n=1 Tax=Helicobacter enhydrae TaxID=222136 RepID=A0A1B1U6P5_9HELI|nr:signal peptide peptidase SppA [Helicobacter enhydrae]ANV98467.1 hypothetical protein BBW65_06500 [Helicobacter enhydrae]